jgi:hypothetical protein
MALGDSLPQLANPQHLADLQKLLRQWKVEVLAVDPVYLSLLAGVKGVNTANLFDMGPLLRRACGACLEVGCTPFLLHHTNRPASTKSDPLTLADLAMAGFPEFARQWLLINHRAPYDPQTGTARLWLSAGGSCGQGGLWAVDLEVGTLADDFTGRCWQVSVLDGQGVQQARQQQSSTRKDQRAEAKLARHIEKWLAALDALVAEHPNLGGASATRIRDRAGLNGGNVGPVVEALLAQGVIEEVPGFKSGKKSCAGYRRKSS